MNIMRDVAAPHLSLESLMTWTEARIAQLIGLWTEGVSASGIAEALGDVSRCAVLGKLHRLHLLRSRKPASAPRRYDGPVLVAAARAGAAVRRTAAAPEPPRSPWSEAALAPLPGTTPRPWLSRTFGECAFPVGGEGVELMSCCAKVKPRSSYCPAHHAIAFRPLSPATEQRRWAEAAERWAA
jgi:GcrA cell cycle regulator